MTRKIKSIHFDLTKTRQGLIPAWMLITALLIGVFKTMQTFGIDNNNILALAIFAGGTTIYYMICGLLGN